MNLMFWIKVLPYILLVNTLFFMFYYRRVAKKTEEKLLKKRSECTALKILNLEYIESIDRAKKFARAGQTVYDGLNKDLLNIEDIIERAKEKSSDDEIWSIINDLTTR